MSSASPNAKLFINYRREDTAPYAGRLYDRLTAHFGADQVFIDIDQIEPGEDFVEAINSKVGACEIAIVAIGPDWLRMTDASGKRRIDDTEDFVRMEILAALERKIRVIPVLVGGARMPTKQDLPEALAPLSRRNAIELSETRFHADVDRLIEAIEKPRAMPTGSKTPSKREETVSAANSNRRPSYGKALIATGVVFILALGCVLWMFNARRDAETASSQSQSIAAETAATPDSTIGALSESTLAALPGPDPAAGIASRLVAGSSTPNLHEEVWMQELRKRAEGGDAEAQFEMGTFYELGFTSIPEDPQKAIEWYRKAAAQGHALAKEGLQDLSRVGAPKSDNEALLQTTRRMSRQQRSSSAVLNAMDAKARDAIKKIKE